ncbi:MAG: SHOCT domain-containing protein [Phycisphaerales bacterium]
MQGDLFGRLLPWLGGLLVLAIVGGMVMLWTRRMAVGREKARPNDGFGMDGLRGMLDRGEITPEEYDRARRKLVQRVRESSPATRGDRPSGKDP